MLEKYPNLCYMAYTTWQCPTWHCLCKCAMYHLARGLLYRGIFYCRVLQSFFSARGLFSLLKYQYDIINVLIRLAICPSFHIKWPAFSPLLQFCLVLCLTFCSLGFVRAPHDLSRYKMSKYEISIPMITPPPPTPPPL